MAASQNSANEERRSEEDRGGLAELQERAERPTLPSPGRSSRAGARASQAEWDDS
jgi:hypothetical protein